jgi:radical SAM/Cys-rich protein
MKRANSVNFDERLRASGIFPLTASSIKTLQVNLGYRCNQACTHCHVEATPVREEIMDRSVMEACLELANTPSIEVVDITGGAPEMHPDYRWFVDELSQHNIAIKTRTNLTILLEAGYEDIPAFLAEREVEIVASLPCYLEENVDSQRGTGTYMRSIKALQLLNGVGYGVESLLVLNLVYNPVGSDLPPSQLALQEDYKRELLDRYNLSFTNLFTITNMPIGRFRETLVSSGEFESYTVRLADNFNAMAAESVMCRETLSIGYDGSFYDCDFNQMLGLGTGFGAPSNISDYDINELAARRIVTGPHCYGCTAGAGSSCGGEVTDVKGAA